MAEDIRVIVDVPGFGSRRHLDIFRDTVNKFDVRFVNKDNQDVDVSAFAVQFSGKRHESDTSSLFDAAGVASAASGVFHFDLTASAGMAIFAEPGVGEFRWYQDGNPTGAPDGRHRLPIRIFDALET